MNIVVDASVAIEYLLQSALGVHAAGVLEEASLLAPELMDAEVLAVLRREVLSERLIERRAAQALADLREWDVERLAHRDLLDVAWSFRRNVSGYDAFYLAAAKIHGALLLTADGPLARTAGLGVPVQNIRR